MTNNQMNSFHARLLPLAMAACLAVALAGCASHAISPEAQANAARENPVPPKDDEFPALSSATWPQGTFPNVEALRAMRTGMGKDQVRELLSWPHFSEGIAGVREWNYIFHFRTGAGPEYVTCQYMVRFNKDVLANGMYWKGPNCAALLNPAAATAVAKPAALPAQAARKITLGADGLFRFDGGSLADLLPEGRRKLDALAGDIKSSVKSVDAIKVTGHTDRLGSNAYNSALSLTRASTVRDYLVQAGVAAQNVQVQGKGESEPKVQCAQAARAALIDCLAPNRRVEIEVFGGS